MSKLPDDQAKKYHIANANIKSNSSNTARLGAEAETMACQFLIDQGMQLKIVTIEHDGVKLTS